jgi:hypothetical protein
LQAYAGTWQQTCDNHYSDRATFTLNADGSLSTEIIETYYANADCTGAVVGTGTFSQPSITIRYVDSAGQVTIKMADGTSISSPVDRISASSVAQSVTFTGTGVTATTVNGKPGWNIVYTGGSVRFSSELNGRHGSRRLDRAQRRVAADGAR